jgi:lipoprotein-releasing system ATP-binding protein
MSEPLVLEARNIVKNYHIGNREVPVLQGMDLQVRRGESIAILGASGAGKSTLLHILGTLDRPTSGALLLDGRDTGSLSEKALAALRNDEVGFIFQFHHLLADFTALENVKMPAMVAGEPDEKTDARARELLAMVGLDERLQHKPGELSGGEQQRVAVARALMRDPAVLLADEPTGNLDRANGDSLADLLWNLCTNGRQTLIIVTHNEEIARRADRRLELIDGSLRDYSE